MEATEVMIPETTPPKMKDIQQITGNIATGPTFISITRKDDSTAKKQIRAETALFGDIAAAATTSSIPDKCQTAVNARLFLFMWNPPLFETIGDATVFSL